MVEIKQTDVDIQPSTICREKGENLANQINLISLADQNFAAALTTLWYGVSDQQGKKRKQPGPPEVKRYQKKKDERERINEQRIKAWIENRKVKIKRKAPNDVKVIKEKKVYPNNHLKEFQPTPPSQLRSIKKNLNKLLTIVLQHVQKMTDKEQQRKAMGCIITTAFQERDCRKTGVGKGDRYVPMRILVYLGRRVCPETVLAVLPLMVEFGYWKDFNTLIENLDSTGYSFDKRARELIADLYANQLFDDFQKLALMKTGSVSLAGKWAPRDKKKCSKQTGLDKEIAKRLGNLARAKNPEDKRHDDAIYRKIISELNGKIGTVEKMMCEDKYDEIKFDKLPGKSLKRNRSAFLGKKVEELSAKRDICRDNFKKYIEDTKTGAAKAKGTAVHPHELVESIFNGTASEEDKILFDAQWKDIVNNLKERNKNIENRGIVVADVSGSMLGTPMALSIAMAILISTVTPGNFNKKFITFSREPSLVDISGKETLAEAVELVKRAPCGVNTDFLAVFSLILDQAVELKLTNEDLPKFILVVSDMQFDQANSECRGKKYSKFINYKIIKDSDETWETHVEILKKAFELAGQEIIGTPYKLPTMIFWNARAEANGAPTTTTEPGAIMISGFSANLVNLFLNGEIEKYTPQSLLAEALSNLHYEPVRRKIMETKEDFSFNLKEYKEDSNFNNSSC